MRIASVLIGGFLALLPALAWSNGGGGGGTGVGSFDAPRELTPAQQAREAYSQGVRAVEQADKSAKAATDVANESKKTKALEKAQKQYGKAREYFVAAVRLQPDKHEAWNYVGYTSRKLGDYDNALAAYAEALRLKPDYADAIEYRGEAYLGLDRIDDVKAAYMSLFAQSRPLADQLMAAMKQWVSDRRANAGSVDAAMVDDFARWIDERSTIAAQTASLAVGGTSPAWN
jgi:tetratricopeptide (TPR) repeat protein